MPIVAMLTPFQGAGLLSPSSTSYCPFASVHTEKSSVRRNWIVWKISYNSLCQLVLDRSPRSSLKERWAFSVDTAKCREGGHSRDVRWKGNRKT